MSASSSRGVGRATAVADGMKPVSHQPISLPDLWLMIDGLAALCGARVCTIAARNASGVEFTFR